MHVNRTNWDYNLFEGKLESKKYRQMSHLADKLARVHSLLKQDGGIPHVVAGHQGVSVVHASRVHGEPVDGSQGCPVIPLQPQLHHRFVYVIFVSATRGLLLAHSDLGVTLLVARKPTKRFTARNSFYQ